MASDLQSLGTQLHAHFLFNALQGISTLTESGPGRAKAMILKLSGRHGWATRIVAVIFLLTYIPTGLYVTTKMNKITRAPKTTRRKILDAAFAEFYRNGFQGGSLNEIVEAAKTTKGALFHHFAGKQELGYAVVGEIIGPLLQKRWMDPLVDSSDPIVELKRVFRRSVKEDIATGSYLQGCPLNNLAQEMSPLDQGFRTRIDKLYVAWRARVAQALTKGVKAGAVKKDISSRDVAALVVASQMGIWGTGKNSRNPELMTHAAEALCAYLDILKP
jgi:AcrR family transcriptional regulator